MTIEKLTYSDQDPYGLKLPVQLFDDITVKPGRQQQVIDLFGGEYAALAAERGLRLVGLWLLPPFEKTDEPADILIHWEYPSLDQLWTARYAEENDARLTRFWQKANELIVRRSRRLGRAPALMTGMKPDENLADLRIANAPNPATRYIAVVKPRAELTEARQGEWLAAAGRLSGRNGIRFSHAGFHVDYSYFPGSFTWDVVADRGRPVTQDDLLAALPGPADITDFVRLGEQVEAGFRERGLANGIRRVVLLRIPDNDDAAIRDRVEKVNLDWAHYMPYTRNWCLTRIAASEGRVQWTHCMDHEFHSIADLTGPYLYHPYHWSTADRLFHREDPQQMVHEFLHTMYASERSVLTDILL